MTRWIRTALVATAVTLGVLLPASAALADDVDPNSGSLVWQLPTSD
ncbi:hypothetical protein [Amycolatopsis mediterranei]|uniref:Secreted protein n=1 Tax=Amycolatopsis mediterranei (strain S699) TaxID=713604 RepID=A0A9R0NQY7_AMYMS|nr:hypothetical protein [Amycolatopsis mediterranei]AEK39012.1 hypothetical protein RAM_02600 [Amycolatopsis mediterranei S699]UZF67506.1 hypothetical protein ISP_000517 [Amycolatopsis mediterranei]